MESADEELSGDEKDDFEGLEVVEGKKGKYECPSFVLSEKEERRICKPWRNGVIVKLLGRKIGYKALENRLQQMWVRDGIITVVDLGNDYFLVDFSSTSDKKAALEKGPWLIYDHYLIVREWAPNFNPEKAAIEKVVVWVRFSGLPIEYYDPKVLKFIGNRIGRTVRVDNTTLLQERGKYARMCVEVDLTKPLLAMFEIQDRCYTVEYEGLHLLCLTCGRFGHYLDGCPNKVDKVPDGGVEGDGGGTEQPGKDDSPQAGPWTVVQKPWQPRKIPATAMNSSGGGTGNPQGAPKILGSRFGVLNEDSNLNKDPNHEDSNLNKDKDHDPVEPINEERDLRIVRREDKGKDKVGVDRDNWKKIRAKKKGKSAQGE